ncbi:hypothetical protein ACFYVR_05005 [Rhodococcus sp. NPDC003318]|uniref:hypothetical protein n=1 Tax=Rhodococcus sp. NPDC003318 TaxID=3364503 RepID=UPI0036D0B4D1
MGRHEMKSAAAPGDDAVGSAVGDDSRENGHLIVYLVAFALFVGLAVWGLVVFHQDENDALAQQKATELGGRFAAAGLAALDVDATARVLGTDGGAACTGGGSGLWEGRLDQQIVSGAAGPGQRPVIVTGDLLEGGRLVLAVYCPDRVADYDEYVEDLKVADG